MRKISKLTLGTAQLGQRYGIANTKGKPYLQSAIEILEFSLENGINSYDTAPAYGNSEEIIGKFIRKKLKGEFNNIFISSKLSPIQIEKNLSFNKLYENVKNSVKTSLKNLQIQTIPFYLLHRSSDIQSTDGLIIECLEKIKNEKLIEHIGVSVYEPSEAEIALEFKEIDVIQLPLNIFDQRFINSNILKRLKERNYIIFIRSIYLQGLFFIPINNLPDNLKIAEKPLKKLLQISKEYNIKINNMAFLFVRDIPEITSIVVGSETLEQLSMNLGLLEENPLDGDLRKKLLNEFQNLPQKIINPSLWYNKTKS